MATTDRVIASKGKYFVVTRNRYIKCWITKPDNKSAYVRDRFKINQGVYYINWSQDRAKRLWLTYGNRKLAMSYDTARDIGEVYATEFLADVALAKSIGEQL